MHGSARGGQRVTHSIVDQLRGGVGIAYLLPYLAHRPNAPPQRTDHVHPVLGPLLEAAAPVMTSGHRAADQEYR